MPGIIVGVDGSDHSRRALDWAMREAALRQTPLTVVVVHEVAGNIWTGNPMVMAEDRPEQERARQVAEDMVAKVASESGGPAPASVSVRAVSGIATHVLIEESQNADLLVVGSRGGGGFARMLMGSVSSQVVEHAACPVLVIR